MIERLLRLSAPGGSISTVSPQNWLYQSYYKKFRGDLLQKQTINLIGALGARAFSSISGEVVNVALVVINRSTNDAGSMYSALDANEDDSIESKMSNLSNGPVYLVDQNSQIRENERKITTKSRTGLQKLNEYATFNLGVCTGDYERFGRDFWEIEARAGKWRLQQTTIRETNNYGGCQKIIFWENGQGALYQFVDERLSGNVGSWLRGKDAWNKRGVLVSAMGPLPVSLYSGDIYDNNEVDPIFRTVWRLG